MYCYGFSYHETKCESFYYDLLCKKFNENGFTVKRVKSDKRDKIDCKIIIYARDYEHRQPKRSLFGRIIARF